MKIFIKLFAVFLLFAGFSLLIKPELIIDWIDNNRGSTSLFVFAIVARLVFGIAFLLAAKESKYPAVINMLGYLFIIAAVTFLVIGQDRFHNLVASLIPHLSPLAPVAGLLSMAFAIFLFYAFSQSKQLEGN